MRVRVPLWEGCEWCAGFASLREAVAGTPMQEEAKEIVLYRWAIAARSRAVPLVVALAVLAGMSGCASKKRDAFNVKLTMDVDNFRNVNTGELPSIDIDVFAANASEDGIMKTMQVGEYFDTNNPYRQSVEAFSSRFTNQDSAPKKLSRRSKYWDDWKRKGARTVYIIANLPRKPGENPELVQTRSVLALPLDRSAWPNGFFSPRTKTLSVLVQPSGLVCETTQRRQ